MIALLIIAGLVVCVAVYSFIQALINHNKEFHEIEAARKDLEEREKKLEERKKKLEEMAKKIEETKKQLEEETDSQRLSLKADRESFNSDIIEKEDKLKNDMNAQLETERKLQQVELDKERRQFEKEMELQRKAFEKEKRKSEKEISGCIRSLNSERNFFRILPLDRQS